MEERTPDRSLLHSATHGDIDEMESALSEGASVSATDLGGNTPLHLAALHGHSDYVRKLLERGANARISKTNNN